VVALSGSAASGAVPLARTLGGTPGFFLAGDIRKMWSRGARDDRNRSCSCGAPFLACPFWREVGDEAFGGWSRVDHERMASLAAKIHSVVGVAKLLSGLRESAFSEYGSHLNRLLKAVAALAGTDRIVVSAKNPSEGFVLGRLAGVPVRWVHVVRDPREVAWLWTIGTVEMKRNEWLLMTTAGIVYRWNRYNLIPPVLSAVGGIAYLRVRFEDLASNHEQALGRVLRFVEPPADRSNAGVGTHGLIVLDRETGPCRLVELEHREQAGAADWLLGHKRWRQELPLAARTAISAATLPVMAAFGYLPERAVSKSQADGISL
jgi:hypothetical protein